MRKLFLLIAGLFFISAASTSQKQKGNITVVKKIQPRIVNEVSELADCMSELDAKIK